MNNLFSKEWWKESLQLNESPPINFEEDDNYQYVNDNLEAISKTAEIFNYPVMDLQQAFNAGTNLILDDDIWSKLENTTSYNIESLGQVILLAKKENINLGPYIKAIKDMKPLPLPLILNYDNDKYYLVAGEIVLSLYRALHLSPDVLQAKLVVQIDEDMKQSKKNIVDSFLEFCKNKLEIQEMPTILYSADLNKVQEYRALGYYNPERKVIWLYVGNRNMADAFRTLSHELTHHKQNEENRLYSGSGDTGSDIENEANSQAGIILRDFGKENVEIYSDDIKQYVELEENND